MCGICPLTGASVAGESRCLLPVGKSRVGLSTTQSCLSLEATHPPAEQTSPSGKAIDYSTPAKSRRESDCNSQKGPQLGLAARRRSS